MQISALGARAFYGLILYGISALACAAVYAQTNLALGGNAVGSTNLQPASFAVDGDLATRWESAHAVDPSWITLDLGSMHNLGSVQIHWEAANAANYLIQGSTDNIQWTTLHIASGGTFGERTDSANVSGSFRYVRIHGTARSSGNTWGYSIREVQVFGAAAASSSSSGAVGNCAQGCVTTLNGNTLRATVTQGDTVDIHYRINGGAQQNLRMAVAGGVWTYDITNLNAGDVVSVSYTIISAGVGHSTSWQDYSLGGTPPVSSSASSAYSSSSTPNNSSVSSAPSSRSSSSASNSSIAMNVVPLYNSNTPLEDVIQYDRGDALVTRISDRGRDRHAKEDQFQAYDHFLSFYWEHRTAAIEIVDYVAKGGDSIRMNVVTQFRLNDTEAENRWFYRGVNTVAEYFDNGTMEVIDDLHYYKERSWNARENRPIQVGDKMEFELSQFLDHGVPNGRAAYYGTTYLYIVGEGLVPWDILPGTFGPLNGTKDSVKIPEKAWLGGHTTLPYMHTNEPDNHFIQMATNLGYDNGQPFVLGRRVHHSSFVDGSHDEHLENGVFAPTVGKAGPHYINDRCAGCHVRNGRAAPAAIGEALDKWIFKVADANGNPDPDLGSALQPKSTGGAMSEGQVSLAGWTEANGLRSPNYQFDGVQPARFSGRIAPQLVGMGLLEAIPESTILAMEDEHDANGDGISGKANRVADPVTNETRLGRFGWKAGASSVKHQLAVAFNREMGVMTSVMPNPDCGANQTDCGSSGSELDDEHLDNLVKYISLLGVRPQRDINDAAVQRGEAQFANIGCAGCHTPALQTSQHHPLAELRDQTIHPYTDLLLHDMGPGLADNLGEGMATGAEWRTTPLWGLGLSACVTGGVVNPQGGQGNEVCTPVHSYLHDGRARSIEEAILWHGGEGQASNNAYQALSHSQKQDVLRFLESL